MSQETGELSPSRQLKLAAQVKTCSGSNRIVLKQDTLCNGTRNSTHDYNQRKEKVIVQFPYLMLIHMSTTLILKMTSVFCFLT